MAGASLRLHCIGFHLKCSLIKHKVFPIFCNVVILLLIVNYCTIYCIILYNIFLYAYIAVLILL